MPYYDSDETDRAARLYFREGGRTGSNLMQPSRSDSGTEGNTVVLRSGDQTLARYRVKAGGRLRKLVS